ncbi:MAG: V-type ATP synthase subunit A [Candidatus Hydrogenedentes bacterium]|nr:V-type ATP synthase subunit A [Candidatus Hydrogenedentota bacterium]
MADIAGKLVRISGPMIAADGMLGVAMGEMVKVGKLGLMGEVIRIDGETAYAQVYEDTSGMFLGEPVVAQGAPLSIELGPGLLGQTYDGIQRPLIDLQKTSGDFIDRGLSADPLDYTKKWAFTPKAAVGQEVTGGDYLGSVPETEYLDHNIMVPPGVSGKIKTIVGTGEYTVQETIATLEDGTELTMTHKWPVKLPRPFKKKLPMNQPFITGQRVLDMLFPIALGGSAIVPGGFGTGKTVVEQQISKFCNADIIVYVGCGERGNEMADVLDEFPKLRDPKTGGPLMNRMILVVNTSNMPVAAREASVYTGITLGEYYRDQGYSVAMMADSTSRWAEALREISSRLEEMPGEEGYPTYLSTRTAEFYERAGRVDCIGTITKGDEGRRGSLTLVGAVSPPGGDFSEPVTQNSMRVAGGFWALDAKLAYSRHYPAINWNMSYSLYLNDLDSWFRENAPAGWMENRQKAVDLLQRDTELQEIVQLVGPDALQEHERLVLEMARMVKETFLQQNAFSDDDAYSSLDKTGHLIEALMLFYAECESALSAGVTLESILSHPIREEVSRLRELNPEGFVEKKEKVVQEMKAALQGLVEKAA